jgi:hypothetical protein
MKFKEAVATATAVVSHKKTRTSKTVQRNWVKRWEISTLTQQVFCEKHKLNLKTFHGWLSKWRSQSVSSACSAEIIDTTPPKLEVTLLNGVEMVLTGSVDERALLAFMKGVPHANKA